MFNESNSQALQDVFVLSVLRKVKGTFIEIGGFHSRDLSNTYLLETAYSWDGVIVEIDERLAAEIAANRKAEVLNLDALNVNWAMILRDNPQLRHVDYLQVDCEPPVVSLQALIRVLLAGVRPSVITFEHDVYAPSSFAKVLHQGRLVRLLSRTILRTLGYRILAADVTTASGKPFEDWYVNPRKISLGNFSPPAGPVAPSDFLKSSGLERAYLEFRSER